jgi:hypothetical protein
VETLISKDHLAMKFAPDGIFYDVTKQAHFRLIKKAVGSKADKDEWEAEKIQVPNKKKGKNE